MTPPLWQKAKRNQRASLKWKKRWKSWLKPQHSKNEVHGIQSHHFMANRWGNSGNSERLYFLGLKFTASGDCGHEITRCSASPWKESYGQTRQHIRKQRHYFAGKGLPSQSSGFSSSHVWMWKLDYKESWVMKNWYFLTVVLENSWESLGLQEDQTSPF